MEPITKLLDKNLSQLRYEETVIDFAAAVNHNITVLVWSEYENVYEINHLGGIKYNINGWFSLRCQKTPAMEFVARGCFWPLSCRSGNLGYSIHVTRAQFVVLSMAFFTFILYKSELLQIGTILVVVDVAIKFLLLWQSLRNLWTVGGPFLTLLFLGMNVKCKIYYSWYWFGVC